MLEKGAKLKLAVHLKGRFTEEVSSATLVIGWGQS